MSSAVTLLLNLILSLSASAGSSTITSIVNTLVSLVPAVEQEIATVGPMIKNIIAALMSNQAVTPDQVVALQVLNEQTDTANESAVSAYDKNHPADPIDPPKATAPEPAA